MPVALKTEVTELPESRVRLQVEVPPGEVQSSVDRKARELARTLRLPGFRRGKVPAPLVIQRIGRQAVLEEAVRDRIPSWYASALQSSGIVPVGDPDVDLGELPPQGESLAFSVEIGVLPKATLGSYKGLEVGRREAAVEDERVDAEIEALRERLARLETADRAAASGDFVVIDCEGELLESAAAEAAAEPPAGEDDAAAEPPAGEDDAAAEPPAGEDDAAAEPPAGEDDAAAEPPAGEDDAAAEPPAGEDDAAAEPPAGEDDAAAEPPAGEDDAAAEPPAGEDETAAEPPAGEDETAAEPPAGEDDAAAEPPAGEDETAGDADEAGEGDAASSFAELPDEVRAAAEGAINGRDQLVELGSGRLLPEFDAALTGASAGEQRTIEITFPAEQGEPLAGRRAKLELTVKEVKRKELPPLDDELAVDAGLDDLQELRQDIRGRLLEAEERVVESEFREAALDAAVAEAQVQTPPALVKARAQEMWERMLHSLSHRGISREAYLAVDGRPEQELIAELEPDAAKALRREAVLTAIVAAEGIAPDEQALEQALAPIAAERGEQTPDLLRELRGSGRLDELREELAARSAIDFVVAEAKAIPLERAKAREQLWTPEREEREQAAGQGDPGAEGEAGRLWTPDR